MVSSSLRTVLCAAVGLFAGLFLGFLFVPDPTGPVGPVLVIVIAAVVGGGLYRTNWLRNGTNPA